MPNPTRFLPLHIVAAFEANPRAMSYVDLVGVMEDPPSERTFQSTVREMTRIGLLDEVRDPNDRRKRRWIKSTALSAGPEITARIAAQAFFRAAPASVSVIAEEAKVSEPQALGAVRTLHAEGMLRELEAGVYEINE